MINKFNSLFTRTATGAIFATLVIGAILLGSYYFFGLFTLIAVLGLREFCSLTGQTGGKTHPFFFSATGAVLLCAAIFFHSHSNGENILFHAYLFFLIVMVTLPLFQKNKQHLTLTGISSFLVGQLTIAFPFALLSVNAAYAGAGTFSKELMLLFFGTIWVNDSAAYLIGSSFGKHKMAAHISPKKSWEGFAGGLLISIATCIGVHFLFKNSSAFFNLYPWWVWGLFTTCLVVSGTIGDFLESLLKRSAGVKDSGNILPGHGGILDRFDSTLMASPVIFLFIKLFFLS